MSPDGIPVVVQLSSKEVDVYESLFDVKPEVGMVYKNKRHVVQIHCPRGIAPTDTKYGTTMSYGDFREPKILYTDIDTKKMFAVSPTDFIEWLGKEWQAEEAPETEETKKQNTVLANLGNSLESQMKAKLRTNEEKEKEKREDKKEGDPNWKQVTPKKSRRQSKK